jgi:hypothetical protein
LTRGRRGTGLGIAAIAALIALVAPGAAVAATLTPNQFDDVPASPGCTPDDCTLREAAAQAGSVDVISVPPGTYQLTQGELFLTSDTVQGAGARDTIIDAANGSRVMWVTDGTTRVSGVTVTRGNGFGRDPSGGSTPLVGPGGGIFVQSGILLLENSAVVNNATTSSGGGIATQGAVAASGVTVSSNRAISGGGIAIAEGDSAALLNSTVSGNIADTGRLTRGGGVLVIGSLSLENVTVAGNEVRVNGVPAADGGGGVYQSSGQTPGTVTMLDTVVAGNAGRGCDAASATLLAAFGGNHNLDDDGTCGFSEVGDRPGVNPLLGPLANNGGPTDTHALGAGSPAINTGDGNNCRPSDQRGFARPAGSCDMGAFEYFPPTEQPGPPPEDGQLPPPIAGKTVNAIPKSGTVRIKLPGRKSFRKLTEGEQIPLGTTIDTLKGRVTLIAAADKKGKTATSDFYGGIFKVLQTSGAKPTTRLLLTEKLSCPKRGKASIAAKRKKRRLWGDGKGKFRTEGEFSSATVRGTKWLVQDSCASTLTRVVRGKVAVRDFVKKKTVIVRKGKRYIARAD